MKWSDILCKTMGMMKIQLITNGFETHAELL